MRSMPKASAPLPAMLLVLACATAEANGDPAVIYAADARTTFAVGREVEVRGPLLQVRLNARWILAAGQGARFQVDPPSADASADRVVSVAAGPLIAADLAANRLLVLHSGSHRLVSAPPATSAANEAHVPLDRPPFRGGVDDRDAHDIAYRQGFRLGDSILARQDSYLDSLSLDVRDINRGLASVIRGLFPR